MINQNDTTTIILLIEKIDRIKNEELVQIVKETCRVDEKSLKVLISLIGDFNFKGLIEYNKNILGFCLEEKRYKSFEVIFMNTDLSREVISTLFLNSVPPLEISLLLNHLETRDRFLNAIKLNHLEELKEIVRTGKLLGYPNINRLIEKAIVQIFTTREEAMPLLTFLVEEPMLKEHQHFILKQSLNLAVLQKKLEIMKTIILDWDIEREHEIDLLLEMDKDQVAISLFNTRELQKSLNQKLVKKPLNQKDEIVKI